MNIKKFYADTAREALRQVRNELGPDAVILSNQRVGGKIEIMAALATDVAAMTTTGGATAREKTILAPETGIETAVPVSLPPLTKKGGIKFEVEDIPKEISHQDDPGTDSLRKV